MRKRIFDIIQIGNREDVPSTAFDIFIALTIIVSITTTILLTFDELADYHKLLDKIEFITIIVFIIEYILRICTSDFLSPGKGKVVAFIRFLFSFDGIIDLLTIASYFMPMLFSTGVVAFRMLRVVRIMRLFTLTGSYDAFNVIYDVLMKKRDQILSSMVMILMLMVMSSVCMYSVEHDVQPENFKNAFSGLWWSVSTILTVGYGDIYPITTFGRFLAGVIAFLGVGLVAIPTGIVSAGFVEYYSRMDKVLDDDTTNDFISVKVDKNCKLKDVDAPGGMHALGVIRNNQLMKFSVDMELISGDKVLYTTNEE